MGKMNLDPEPSSFVGQRVLSFSGTRSNIVNRSRFVQQLPATSLCQKLQSKSITHMIPSITASAFSVFSNTILERSIRVQQQSYFSYSTTWRQSGTMSYLPTITADDFSLAMETLSPCKTYASTMSSNTNDEWMSAEKGLSRTKTLEPSVTQNAAQSPEEDSGDDTVQDTTPAASKNPLGDDPNSSPIICFDISGEGTKVSGSCFTFATHSRNKASLTNMANNTTLPISGSENTLNSNQDMPIDGTSKRDASGKKKRHGKKKRNANSEIVVLAIWESEEADVDTSSAIPESEDPFIDPPVEDNSETIPTNLERINKILRDYGPKSSNSLSQKRSITEKASFIKGQPEKVWEGNRRIPAFMNQVAMVKFKDKYCAAEPSDIATSSEAQDLFNAVVTEPELERRRKVWALIEGVKEEVRTLEKQAAAAKKENKVLVIHDRSVGV
ncbi:hypothetical protein BJ878DRAFT_868 [Calycina marina]|uniref:Uncharacterized protein n=1 Tax=Calycina marina TaxID=1763456 RepID=A0A9P8CJE7_9HELO|nr:hypothetical protein BJ878DRAFT_868 [Calycina marina]